MKTTLIWTTLPNGAVSDASGGLTLRLSVLVSPRLDPEGPTTSLDAFDLGIGDNFTAWIQSAAMAFAFGSPGSEITLPATLVNAGEGALNPTLWPLVFPPSTPVRGYVYDSLTSRRLRSFPVREVQGYLAELYGTLAKTSPGTFPAVGTSNPFMTGLFDTLGGIRANLVAIEKSGQGAPSDAEILQGLGVPNNGPEATRALAFYKAYRFYRRRVLAGPADPDRQPPQVPEPDFHEMVAVMADYPVLLRKLGLVLDFEISTSATALPADSFVRAMPASGAGMPSNDKRPLTAYTLSASAGRFLPKPRAGSEISDGVLDLSEPGLHTVVQVDVDGSALKTVDFAGNIQRLATNWPQAAPAQEPVPALRSAGFAIVQSDRAARLAASFPLQDQLNTALASSDPNDVEQTPLYADDVVRGYRPDVEAGGTWYSLCRRLGSYTLDSKGAPVQLGPFGDEGYVKGAAVSGEADLPDDLYAHEAVFGWDGWSLAAPRPGRTLSFEKDQNDPRFQTTTVAHADNTPVTSFDVQADFRAEPGTLPRLRFGGTYRFRARAVDLAGNGLPLSLPTSQSLATEPHDYLRYEPLQQAILVYRARVTEGESLEHLVIRSNRGVSAAGYVALPEVAPYGYAVTCERHVAAPKVSQGMAEVHGAFDDLWAGEDPNAHRTSYLLALKEAGTFQDQEVFDPQGETLVPVTDIELVSTATTPPDRVDIWPERRGDPLATGQYVIHKGESVSLPYLPDPLVVGVTLEDTATGEVYQRAFAGGWPDLAPFRLVVREGSEVDAEPRIEVNGGTLDVFLPQATIYKLRYSCYADPNQLDKMVWFQGLQGEALARARSGTHWMLTPQREMTLVHAVQRPLTDPVAQVEPDETRTPGQTFATMQGQVSCHSRSSARVDVEAYWVDPVDLLTDPGPTRVGQRAHILELTPSYGSDVLPLGMAAQRHELGDTKHRMVVYQAVATTRYREYFPQAIWRVKANMMSAESVAAPGTLGDNEPAFTKEAVSVLSTARPEAPKVLYIVPSFRWAEADQGKRKTRRAGAVRVYLDRPWYSSGDGELLGALVMPAGGNEEILERYVSEWGSDPLRKSFAPQNRLGLGHFRGEKRTGKGLSLADGPGGVVDVAGYEPEYNGDRQLWFCDIELDTGQSYFPFLRLALARYQPESLPGLELSRVVRADFVQLPADRSAAVRRANQSSVEVALSGTSGDNPDGLINVPEPAGPTDLAAPLPSDSFDIAAPDLSPAPTKAERHVVRARLERRIGDTDLDWLPLDQGVELPAYQKGTEPGIIVWRGTLPLPEIAQGGDDVWRIAVLEYDVFETDPDVAQNDTTVAPIANDVASRLVFAAHLRIPA